MKLRIDSLKHGQQWVYFDDADCDIILIHRWSIQRKPNGVMYARANINKGKVTMHRYLTGIKGIDHVNGMGLDNRQCNLRQATSLENSYNRKANRNNKTGFKGVSKQGNHGFSAQIHHKGVKIHIGLYEKAEEAAVEYDRKAKELHGEYASLNFGEAPDCPVPSEHVEVIQ